MQNANDAVFEYLIDQLRQQVTSNRCEAPAHEVQSLKSELARYKKPYIAYVEKTNWVQGDSRFLKKWGKHRADILRECIQEQDAEIQSLKNQLRDASAQIKELHLALVKATGDAEAYKLVRKGGPMPKGKSYIVGEHAPGPAVNCRCTRTPVPPEQSGCRKEDTQECHHHWRFVGDCKSPAAMMCRICGLKK